MGVLVVDADDAESFRIPRPRACVQTSSELHFDLVIDGCAVESLHDIEDLLALQRNGASAPFPQICDDLQLGVGFEATHELAAVLIGSREAAVLVVR